ncbi:hypothetical protein [Bdellovibrio svalbardensis]|uniref:DUF2007 domain-containing protein n=1 Tax=Bdellovibrio svalbardensis TaxID=2972972 RepID=A0ABT6DG98_9BACT|nr:hypothetical protein [Bdellovibrio svalbardensis]MDG0815841.1 hypothetical protein [Bdellovibrio svalbardensis]
MSSYVFLTECADFGEAQVVKSFLVSQGFHPKVRDEQMRAVAPHLQNLLGKLIIEIPEEEAVDASQALESLESRGDLHLVNNEEDQQKEVALALTQNMAKKTLINAVLGCVLIPVICNFYSMILGWRVMAAERPLSRVTRQRLILAVIFNTIGFYIWLGFGLKYFLQHR